MTTKFYYKEPTFEVNVPTFSTDLIHILENEARKYSNSGGDRTSAIVFALKEAVRITKKLESIYLAQNMKKEID